MEHNNDVRRPVIRTGLAVTLISGSDYRAAMDVAAQLSGEPGAPPESEVETPGESAEEFGVELAESLARDADNGNRGNALVVLEPDASVMEVALVFERVVEQRDSGAARVGIRDVIAVSSVAEVRALLFGDVPKRPQSGSADPESLNAPEQLAERLEFASIIVLTDLADLGGNADLTDQADRAGNATDPQRVEQVLMLLAKLSPAARVLPGADLGDLVGRGTLLFRRRAHQLAASMGWQRELSGRVSITEQHAPVGTFVFRDPRPFHPERLSAAVASELVPERVGRILRSRGLVRLASRPDRVGSWATAGEVLRLDPTGMLSWDADSPIGQEIVFFGHQLDREALTDVLGRCVLTPAELVAGADAWSSYADPFPGWEHGHEHGHRHGHSH
jgi:G3E family GTPase